MLNVYNMIYAASASLSLTFLASQHCSFCIVLQLALVKCCAGECERVTDETCKG